MNRDIMIAELARDEGLRLAVYDDANGAAIRPGNKVIGHPTIGIGRALDLRGITTAEARYLLVNDIDSFHLGLLQRFTWYSGLDEVRQRVLLNMAFNMGVDGLSGFHETLQYISEQRWGLAASSMEASLWYRQVGNRAKRLAQMMLTGAE